MSGGHFDYNQYYIDDIIHGIQLELDRQGKLKPKDEIWENDNAQYIIYHKDIQKEFKKAIKILKKAFVYAQRIDYFLSGDDSEESFYKGLLEELKKLKETK